MAKLFVAVEAKTENEEFVIKMSKTKRVKKTSVLLGETVDVPNANFYCLDYGEKTKTDEVGIAGQSLYAQKTTFPSLGAIYKIMIAGNNVDMEKFLDVMSQEGAEILAQRGE